MAFLVTLNMNLGLGGSDPGAGGTILLQVLHNGLYVSSFG